MRIHLWIGRQLTLDELFLLFVVLGVIGIGLFLIGFFIEPVGF